MEVETQNPLIQCSYGFKKERERKKRDSEFWSGWCASLHFTF